MSIYKWAVPCEYFSQCKATNVLLFFIHLLDDQIRCRNGDNRTVILFISCLLHKRKLKLMNKIIHPLAENLNSDTEARIGGITKPTGDFPTVEVYMTRNALNGKVARSALGFGFFATLTWLSYFSGDPYNTIYQIFGPVALYFLHPLSIAIRQWASRSLQIKIDTSGFYIRQPDNLFWSWSLIKGVRSEGHTIIVDLITNGGFDQGILNRTEVIFSAKPLDVGVATIEQKINEGIKHFNPQA